MLYGSCTLDIDSDNVGYVRMIALLAVKQEQRNTVDLFENWHTAVSAVAIRTLRCDR